MARVPHLDLARFQTLVGDDELLAIGGTGGWNTPDGRGVDEDRVTLAIAYADQVVEGFLRGRYPAGTTHSILTQAASDIARYRLRSDANAATVSDEVRRRHEDAMRLVRDIQAGRQALTDAGGATLGTADGPTGSVMTSIDDGAARPERAPEILRGWL